MLLILKQLGLAVYTHLTSALLKLICLYMQSKLMPSQVTFLCERTGTKSTSVRPDTTMRSHMSVQSPLLREHLAAN